MNILSKNEKKTINDFLALTIPSKIHKYNTETFDLMDCYEIAFNFANALLRGKKINPNHSPWGDGQSVIFDPKYTALLLTMQNDNISTEVGNYCKLFLEILDIFKAHFI